MRLPTWTMSKTLLSRTCGVLAKGTAPTTPGWATPTADAVPVPTSMVIRTAGTTTPHNSFQNLRMRSHPLIDRAPVGQSLSASFTHPGG
jgi:hypothetical protein